MPNLERMFRALEAADAAGDTRAARLIAQAIRAEQAQERDVTRPTGNLQG